MIYNNNIIKTWIKLITTRAHINTMEMVQFDQIFKIIANNVIIPHQNEHINIWNIKQIHIISDSLNTINIIKQTVRPEDDALIMVHKEIEHKLQRVHHNTKFQSTIKIH